MVAAVALNAALTVVIALPVLPVTTFGRTVLPALNQAARDQVGWPVYVRTLAEVYAGLSAQDRSQAILIGDDYGEAGALDRYGPAYGLPSVYSGQNGLWFYGPPPDSAKVAVIWTEYPPAFSSRFASCQQRAVMDDGVGVDNEEQGSAVLVCRDPVRRLGRRLAARPALQLGSAAHRVAERTLTERTGHAPSTRCPLHVMAPVRQWASCVSRVGCYVGCRWAALARTRGWSP